MRASFRLPVGLGLAACLSVTAEARPSAWANLERERAAIEADCDLGKFSGRVLVRVGGSKPVELSCGLADRGAGLPVTARARFKLASVTKPLTALAVLRLAECGRLGLDDPVTRFLPEAPESWSGVRVRHLLQHTSGIADQIERVDQLYRGDQSAAVLAVIAELRKGGHRPAAAPGETFDYSNFNYELLALIVGRASGLTYEDALRELVFRPAGMKHAGVETGDEARTRLRSAGEKRPLARGHVEEEVVDEEYAHVFRGSGSVFATADDLLALDSAIAEGRLLSPQTRRRLEAEAIEIQPGYRQSLAGLLRTIAGEEVWYQWGAMDGFKPYFGRVEKRGLTVVVLSNLNGVKPNLVGEKLVEAALADLQR